MESELYKIEIKNCIDLSYFKVAASLDELIEKHPDRKDLIGSMTETKNDLQMARKGVRVFCDELSMIHSRNYELETLLLSLKRDLEKLEKINQKLADRVLL